MTADTKASVRFPGFPAGARATAVPSVFFSHLLPQIEDASELRVTLYAMYALGRRKGYPRFVTERELRAEGPLMASLTKDISDGGPEALANGLAAAVNRGSLLRLEVQHEGRRETLVMLNSPSGRRAVELIQNGRLALGRPLAPETEPAAQRANVYQLYEENIGALTPIVAEALKEAEQLYPFEWLEEALQEAAMLNKRSWRYAEAILRRWATEGRTRETPGRDPGSGGSARAQLLQRYRSLGGD